jgi:putative serine protease PepD
MNEMSTPRPEDDPSAATGGVGGEQTPPGPVGSRPPGSVFDPRRPDAPPPAPHQTPAGQPEAGAPAPGATPDQGGYPAAPGPFGQQRDEPTITGATPAAGGFGQPSGGGFPPAGSAQGGPQQGGPQQGGSSAYPQGTPYGSGYPGAYGSPYGQQPPPTSGDTLFSFGAPPPPPETPFGDPAGVKPPNPRRRTVSMLVITAILAGLVGGGVGAAVTYGVTHDQGVNSLSSLSSAPVQGQPSGNAVGDVSRVAAAVLPSVVSITTSEGSGSGIILSGDGTILTNNHVVSAATNGGSLTVQFNDGKQASARILGQDAVADLAVIKANNVSGLHAAALGSSSTLQVGQPVVAIGSPFGLNGTVTSGIVSALNRPVDTSASEPQQPRQQQNPFDGGGTQDQGGGGATTNTVLDAIQTDAPINPGNSGGPLVNLAGQVIGINSAIRAASSGSLGGQAGSIGLGFSIPIDQAKPIADDLIKTGHANFTSIGASVGPQQPQSNGLPGGAVLRNINPGGPADKGGLKTGDTITKINNRMTPDPDTLIAAIRSYRPGTTVTFTYIRNGQTQTAQVTLGSTPAS